MITCYICVVTTLLCFRLSGSLNIPASCPNLTFGSIPKGHLFHEKQKPVIIAHRGQPKKFQENTLDRVLSVQEIHADGFEVDIYVTKDKKLVLFHDDNTERMTGVSKTVWESTYEELQQLNITTNITAGGKTYIFDKPRKIPLLEEVLNATKDTDLLHYLEMKPSTINNSALSNITGQLVADMVTRFGIMDKTVVVSFDFHKVYAVKQRNPKITVGTLFSPSKISIPKEAWLAEWFPSFMQCAIEAPNDTFGIFQFVLQAGLPFKYSGSASFDTNIDLYDNAKYSNNTLEMLRRNYNPDISTGFYTVYGMFKTETQNLQDEVKLKNLYAQGGGERMITDDVTRLRKLMEKESTAVKMNGQPLLWIVLMAVVIFM